MLIFVTGLMNCGKTHALVDKYCRANERSTIVLTVKNNSGRNLEAIDGMLAESGTIQSRTRQKIDARVWAGGKLNFGPETKLILIDEAQWLSLEQIDQLVEISVHVQVYCYGLRKTHQGKLWDASMELLRVADVITVLPPMRCKFDNCANQARHDIKIAPFVDNDVNANYAQVCDEHC